MDADNAPVARTKLQVLGDLREEYRDCGYCFIRNYRQRVVMGDGNPDARIFVLGGAPDSTDEATGDAFHPDGPAGHVLRALFESMGTPYEEVFRTHAVACVPRNKAKGRQRAPDAAELANCSYRLKWEIYTVDPRLIITLGKDALSQMVGGANLKMGTGAGRRLRFEIEGHVLPKISYPVIATWHPDTLLQTGELSIDKKTGDISVHGGRAQGLVEHIKDAVHLAGIPRAF